MILAVLFSLQACISESLPVRDERTNENTPRVGDFCIAGAQPL